MGMLKWAEKEVELASKRERENDSEGGFDYGVACYESALKAFKSLLYDGHSGVSISITKGILNRLIDGKPLTPIEDTEDVWRLSYEKDGKKMYQCKRMGSLFKTVTEDGTVVYDDVDSHYCITEDNPIASWHNGFVSKIYNDMFPLTMPYTPKSKPDVVVCEELLTDCKNGDYDTLAILYIEKADGEIVDVNRFFKEGDESFIEISLVEYEERAVMDRERREHNEISDKAQQTQI